MAADWKFYTQKKSKGIYYSFAFLLLIIVGTVGLFFYNTHLTEQNQELLSQISQRQNSIDALRQDKNIEAYYIYNLNQDILTNLWEKSQISTFVKHALSTMIGYDLTFESFTYNSGEISVNAVSESSDKGLAYTKVVKFLSEYNKNQRSLFELQPIENFTWQDSIKFPISFTVK